MIVAFMSCPMPIYDILGIATFGFKSIKIISYTYEEVFPNWIFVFRQALLQIKMGKLYIIDSKYWLKSLDIFDKNVHSLM